MIAGDSIRITWAPKGKGLIEERHTLRYISGVSIVVEPEPGRIWAKRIPWDMVYKVSKFADG